MTYEPTKEELEEMKFSSYMDTWYYEYRYDGTRIEIKYRGKGNWSLLIQYFTSWIPTPIFPESKEEIEVLIKVFTDK